MASIKIIFIHGLCCDGNDWSAQMAHFAHLAEVIAPDMPGHGSAAANGGPSIEAMADVVNRVRQQTSAAPTVLAGHSMGCRIALEAARRKPDGMAGLVLLEGSQRATGDADAAVRQYRSRPTEQNIATLLEDFQGMFSPATPASFQAMALDRIKRMDPGFIEHLVASLTRWDAAEAATALQAVKVPVLVMQSTVREPGQSRRSIVHGEMPSWLRLVRETVPGETELAWLTELSHFPQVDAPERVNAPIAAFLHRLAGQPNATSGPASV